jgi:hypothetical protein
MKLAFSKELSRRLIDYYGRMPSASVVSRDFNLRANEEAAISQETARRWMRSLSLPEIERLQILVEWLGLDMSFLTTRQDTAEGDAYKGQERRSKGVTLDPLETFLLKCFKETDARGKHCLINLAKSLHERPNPSL